jgi:hypothetical protein
VPWPATAELIAFASSERLATLMFTAKMYLGLQKRRRRAGYYGVRYAGSADKDEAKRPKNGAHPGPS